MKTSALIIAGCVATTSAFAPSNQGARVSTEVNAEKTPLFNRVFGMDLFAPNADQNDYGARSKKNVKVAEITGKSYVPAGLTQEQYNKLRKTEAKKKADNYEKNVKKAGIFIDYTDWYIKRGTDTNESWSKDVNKGHTMAKTKYDWSGSEDIPQWAKKAGAPTKAAPKKAAAAKKSPFSFFQK